MKPFVVSDSADRCLFDQIRTGHSPALNTLLNRHWPSLVAYAARLLDSWDAAEDVAQETFVRIWERRETWTTEGSVRALLYQITRNLALDTQKQRRRRAEWAHHRYRPPQHVATPSDELEASELEAAFKEAVAALPERRREIFLLARLDRLSYQQIAEVMGIAPQTVANQLSSALATLRERLDPFLDGREISPRRSTPTAPPAEQV